MSARNVIEVERLAKRYTLRHEQPRHDTLRDLLTHGARAWWRRRAAESTSARQEAFWALRDVSFQVAEGDRLGIIGRNGAGKSTLLKVLSRITEPSAGQVRMRGRVASLLEVGTGFHPELSGRENIYLNGAILGMRRQEIRRRFDEIVAFSDVERFLDTPVKRYSSGMYVRLAFAVAAHLEPEVLIVDEVLAVGDQEFQKKCLGKMQAVGQEGRTVIFVSHNLAAVSQLCRSALLLSDGQVEAAGPVGEVVSAYLSRAQRAGGSAELTGGPLRPGTQAARFTWAEVQDASGAPCREFSLGEDVAVSFRLHFTPRFTDRQVRLSVLLRRADGTMLCDLNDQDSQFDLTSFGTDETLTVTLRDLRLYPDTYYLGLWAGSDYGDETHDFAEDCLSFEVIGGGRLTTRRLNTATGVLFLTPEWRREQPTARGRVARPWTP